jgi:hypothetical protein
MGLHRILRIDARNKSKSSKKVSKNILDPSYFHLVTFSHRERVYRIHVSSGEIITKKIVASWRPRPFTFHAPSITISRWCAELAGEDDEVENQVRHQLWMPAESILV